MDRRKTIKALTLGSLSAGILLDSCKLMDKKEETKKALAATEISEFRIDRMKEEAEHDRELMSKHFFTEAEMATITLLADIIIPADEVSGSASQAGVPVFIDFIVLDMPDHQVPMRGGLRWLDMQCLNRYGNPFTGCTEAQRMEIVDEIAWPKKAKPSMSQGVAFFNLMRNLTASGFYTTEMGVKDIGYVGNSPNKWKGVPEDELKRHGLAYTEKEVNECAKYD